MTKSAKKLNIKDRVDDNTIDLSLADISEVPVKEIAVFKRVTIVDLSNNKISSLGPNIGLLAHLVKLDLSKNNIRMLPEAFGQLVNLRHLDLYNNQLDHLPLEMGQLKSLRYLDLKGNPLKVGLAKIVGTCLTVQECQLAAKRIVPFLADMQIQIREDRERLRRDKQLREAEQERLLQEQQQLEERNGQAQVDGEGQAKMPKTKPKRERKRKDATAERSNGETVASGDDNISATIEQNDAAIRPSDNTNGRKFNRIILTVTLLLTLLIVVFRGYALLSDEQKSEYTKKLDRWRQHVSTGIVVPMSRELIKVYQLCGQSITNIANLLSGWIRS